MSLADTVIQEMRAIRWRKFPGAHGPPTILPDLLHTFRYSGDTEVRDEIFEWVGDILFHQRTHYDATPVAIPYLIRLLEDPETPDKDSILYLLSDIAEIRNTHYSASSVPHYPPLAEQSLRVIAAGEPVFRALLTDALEETRRAARSVLDEIKKSLI